MSDERINYRLEDVVVVVPDGGVTPEQQAVIEAFLALPSGVFISVNDSSRVKECDWDFNETAVLITDPRIQDPEGWARGDYDNRPGYEYLYKEVKRRVIQQQNLAEFAREVERSKELFRNLDRPIPWDHDCPSLKRVTTSISDICEYCGVERPQARTDSEH